MRAPTRVGCNRQEVIPEPSKTPRKRKSHESRRDSTAKSRRTSNGEALRYRLAPHRPSFLIHCPELETNLTCTKQTAGHIPNRQFFALLKLPDTLPPGSLSRADCTRPKARKAPHTTGNRDRLIGNRMHSPANATILECSTSIFLIGNEFRLQDAAFQRVCARQAGDA